MQTDAVPFPDPSSSRPQAPSSRPQAFVLSSGLENIHTQYEFAEPVNAGAALVMLAEALTSSPLWNEIPRAVMVVRTLPTPTLGIVGYFDAVAESRLSVLHAHLKEVLPRLRYVDYSAAEQDCEQLAHRLIERFGREELLRFRYAPLPRGGLIVLGMLSYVLDLRHEQLEPPHSPDVPIVVVDDCALTGLRFASYLKGSTQREVVFAPLYAHPELRARIEDREPRVIACVSAQDLVDHAPENLGKDYPDWRARWEARSGSHSYWTGQPDHVCFPWNEPDVTLWNAVTDREEPGWHVVPPSYCLKNRPPAGAGTERRLQVQPTGNGCLRPAPDVFFAELEGELIVADAKAATSFSLAGVAAELWRAVVAGGTVDDAVHTLIRAYDVDEPTLRADLTAFTEDLISNGLLVRNEGCTPDG